MERGIDEGDFAATSSGDEVKNATIRSEVTGGGAVRTLLLDGPPGNVIGISTCREFLTALEAATSDARTKLVVVRGAGKHFSFGASVEEHLPEQAREMLAAFHDVIRVMVALPLPTLAAVSGRCLGGGFELALSCGLAWAEEGSVFAAPEIKLGVFAPAATALLDGRIPRAMQEEILLTGRDVPAGEALRWGLVNRVVPAGGLDAAIATFAAESLVPRSAIGLRAATKAIRSRPARIVRRRLAAHERLYAKDLLSSEEGSEGIRAFLEKREPRWEALQSRSEASQSCCEASRSRREALQ
jgi:cyclohexa-1,5-dienecarbonyl-CoA hydratase